MSKKLKFRPGITRIELNPEQAVLACNCFANGLNYPPDGTPNRYSKGMACELGMRRWSRTSLDPTNIGFDNVTDYTAFS